MSEVDTSGYFCRLRYKSVKTGEVYTVEGISQRDIVLKQIPASNHTLRFSSVDTQDGVPLHQIEMRSFTLSNFPLIYIPMVLRAVPLSGTGVVLEFMKSVMIDVFPESRAYVYGHQIPSDKIKLRKGKNRDVFIKRTLKAWNTKTSVPALEEYLWRKWLEIIGDGALGVMKRSSPGARQRLATFTSEFTRKSQHPRDAPRSWKGH